MGMEQTTLGQDGQHPKKQPVEAVQYDLKGLMDIMQDLKAQRDALKKRVEFLEERLTQRYEETRKDFQRLQPYLENMRAKILQVFVELPPTIELCHEEIIEEFKAKYPMLSTANVPRRVRELVEQGKLWSHKDEKGVVRFSLKLKEEKIDGSIDRSSQGIGGAGQTVEP